MGLRTLKAALFLLSLPGLALALGNGTSNSDFTKIGVGARPSGMGEAFAAVADDANATYWNPAGLALVDRPQLSAMHMLYIADISFDSVGVVYPSSRWDSWSVMTNYVWQAAFDSTSNDFGIPASQAALGTASDLSLAVGYAHNFGNFRTPDLNISNIMVGGSLRYISRSLQNFQASGLQGDLGVIAEPWEGLRTALVIQNLGTTITFINSADPSVTNVKAGLSYHFAFNPSVSLLAAADVNHPVDLSNNNYNRWRENLGTEIWLFNAVALRGGYEVGYDVGSIAFGAGFKWQGLELDYAYVPYSVLGDTHRFSVSYSFGNAIPRPEVAAPSPPRDLTGIAGDRFVSLAWAASPEKDVVGYNVYYSRSSGKDYVRTTERPELKARSLRVQLQNNQHYYFVVTAVNEAGKESDFSDEISLSPFAPVKPATVRGLNSKVLGRTVELSWVPDGDRKVIGYNVYYTKTPGQDYRKLTKAALMTEPRCQLKGLVPGTTYYFTITQVNREGVESDFSKEVAATPTEGAVEAPVQAPKPTVKRRPSYLDQPF